MSDVTGGEGPSPADATAEERPSDGAHTAAETPVETSAGDGVLNPPEDLADPIPEVEPPDVPAPEPPVEDLTTALEGAVPEEGPPTPAREATGAGGDQIEWQPVVEGDQIEWQPVVSSEVADSSVEEASAASEPQPEFEYPEGTELEAPWEPDVAEAASPVSGNGAVAGTQTTDPLETEDPGATGETAEPALAAPASVRRSSGARPKSLSDEPDGGDDDRRRAAAKKTKRQVIVLSILTLVVIAVAVLGFVLSRGAKDKGNQAATGSSLPTNTVPRLPDTALQTYTDDATGFTVKFAKTWEILRAPNADIRLVVNAGGNDGFQVRVAPIQTPATVQNIENFKAVTDAVVFGDKTARSVKEQLITVNGLLAYYYLYTFHDPVSNSEGVHAQYFVFEGNRMFMMTFQTVPSDEFAKQATLWDQVAESFTVKPRPDTTTTAPPASTSTTVP